MTIMKQIQLKREPNLVAKIKAFAYQVEAVEAIKDLEYAAIFHEQGLGKTKIAIDLMLYWLDKTDIDTVLVVTKKQLVQNWINEFRKHTLINPAILSSNKQDNYYVFTGPARIVITNFETLSTEKERFTLYLNTRNVAIIIDESTKLKNPDSKLTKTFFDLSLAFKKRVIMSGTPIANRPYDIWSQIFFLDGGKSLGDNFKQFKRSTDLSNKLADDGEEQKLFEASVSKIFQKIETFSVRETKNSGIISLPQKVFIREDVIFLPEQLKLYNKIKDELIIEIQKEDQLIIDDSSATVKRLLRLLQVASNPRLIDQSFVGESAKEIKLDDLISDIVTNGEKCIIWTCFVENINFFCKKYKPFGARKIHGGMTISDRNKSVDNFKQPECKVLFATPASAKEGLTLTMANHVIFYDRGFSLDDYLQAQDRIHRISQIKTCYIHNLILNDSIDEWVDLLLIAKQNAALLAQGDVSIKQYRDIADYSYGDIIKEILFPNKEDVYE